MEVKLEDIGSCRKVMRINASADVIISDYNNVVEKYTENARIPGFRRGKAPVNVVERHYAKSINEDAKDRIIPRIYHEALTQEKLNPVTIVEVKDVDFKKETGIVFNVVFDLAPKIKLPKYKKIVLKANSVEVKEKDIDKALEGLINNFARYEDVNDRNVKDGDLVLIDYTGVTDDRPVNEIAPDCSGLGEGKDFWMLMGEPEFIPGFIKGLEGSEIGEKREIKVQFPDDYHVAVIAGEEAVYTVNIKGIREKTLPDINDEFLKRLNVDSENSLREKINKELLENNKRAEDVSLKDDIVKFLLDKTDFELPQSIVDRETNLIVRDMIERNIKNGVAKEEIDKHAETIVGEAKKASGERVKLSYILENIANDVNIEVEEAEVEEYINLLAGRYQMEVDKLKAKIEKDNMLEAVKDNIRADKTLNYLLENAKIKK